jgi:hypothetical protein
MEIQEEAGVETLYVHSATVSGLAAFLNPDIPWVWILGHMPNRYVQWWEAELPTNKFGASLKAAYRNISYDLMLPTQHFIESLPQFEEHGIVLIQSSQRMPDTLELSRIPESQQPGVLVKNGAFLRLYLPHAVETAQVQCFEKGYLGRKIALNHS